MQKQQQPRDFNAMTATRTPEKKRDIKQGTYTGLILEPGMPGFNHFSRKKNRKNKNTKA